MGSLGTWNSKSSGPQPDPATFSNSTKKIRSKCICINEYTVSIAITGAPQTQDYIIKRGTIFDYHYYENDSCYISTSGIFDPEKYSVRVDSINHRQIGICHQTLTQEYFDKLYQDIQEYRNQKIEKLLG